MVARVAVQSRGPRNTHREVTYLQLGSPAMCMRVAVCLHMQTWGLGVPVLPWHDYRWRDYRYMSL